MARKSDFEEIVETTFKYPFLGIIAGTFLGGIGLYLRSKGSRVGAKPVDTIFNATFLQFSKFFFWISGFFFLLSIIGFIWWYFKKKNRGF